MLHSLSVGAVKPAMLTTVPQRSRITLMKKRRIELLRHLRAELAARRRYLTFWETQEPIEIYSPPIFAQDIRSNLIEAAKAEIKVMEHALELLKKSDTEGP